MKAAGDDHVGQGRQVQRVLISVGAIFCGVSYMCLLLERIKSYVNAEAHEVSENSKGQTAWYTC